jgi:quercetin dioxygenase-like cupin family protein
VARPGRAAFGFRYTCRIANPQESAVSNQPVFSASQADATRSDTSWGSLRWVANKDVGNVEGLTLGRVVIRKGQSNPRHCHRTCEEVLYLLAGKLEHTIGDDKVILEPGDALAIPPGVFHNAVSIGDVDADMIVAYSTGERDFVLE